VSNVLGSAVSQVRPHFPRFAQTLHANPKFFCFHNSTVRTFDDALLNTLKLKKMTATVRFFDGKFGSLLE